MCLQIVYGEIYYVDDKFLARLDRFEGHPYLYQRDVITVSVMSHAEHGNNVTVSSIVKEKQEIVKCKTYLKKHFDEALLEKETFSSYDSSGPHGQPYRQE